MMEEMDGDILSMERGMIGLGGQRRWRWILDGADTLRIPGHLDYELPLVVDLSQLKEWRTVDEVIGLGLWNGGYIKSNQS